MPWFPSSHGVLQNLAYAKSKFSIIQGPCTVMKKKIPVSVTIFYRFFALFFQRGWMNEPTQLEYVEKINNPMATRMG
jgi:hypothetical protein